MNTDSDLFGTMVRVENKDIFIDLKKNNNGTYLKITERKNGNRNTILIPSSGIVRIKEVLDDVLKLISPEKSAGPVVSRESKEKAPREPKPRKNRTKATSAASAVAASAGRSIYVNGLPWETTDEELRDHFSSEGSVVNAYILKRKGRRGQADRSMGCGIVEYVNASDAKNAILKFNETTFQEREIRCREDRQVESAEDSPAEAVALKAPKKPAEERELDPMRIFVGNLPDDVTRETLSEFFSGIGGVERCDIKSGRRRGSTGGRSATVTFLENGAAETAVATLNNADFHGRVVTVREFYTD